MPWSPTPSAESSVIEPKSPQCAGPSVSPARPRQYNVAHDLHEAAAQSGWRRRTRNRAFHINKGQIARCGRRGMASDESRYIAGAERFVDGGSVSV
jgi:hypothetical protein